MNSFICEYCGAEILDSPKGYLAGCSHYLLPKMSIGENKKYLAGLREKAKLSWSGVDLDKFLNEMRRD